MDFFRIQFEELTTKPTILFEISGIPFSTSMMSSILLTILLVLFVFFVTNKLRTKGTPSRLQLVLESIYATLLDLVEKIVGDKVIAGKIMPIVLTILIYIAISNIFTLLPFISGFTYGGKSVFSTSTKDLNVTLGIALTVVGWTHFSSIKKFNLINHINKFVKVNAVIEGFKKGIGAGLLSIIDFMVGFLDIISEVAKSMSLSLRLFGNMFAGEVLTVLIMSLFAIILPVPLMFLSVFTGVLQAIVFAALSSSYFGASLKE